MRKILFDCFNKVDYISCCEHEGKVVIDCLFEGYVDKIFLEKEDAKILIDELNKCVKEIECNE